MATLIPALSACVSRMTSGERRLAERLEQKLDADYLIWYDVPVGPQQLHPDFIVLHPSRGALILETKDWRLDTIRKATRQYFEIVPDGQLKTVMNPLQPEATAPQVDGLAYQRTKVSRPPKAGRLD